MELTDLQRKFVLHWGEMGSLWGVNRTVSQIHALLFVHGKALHAEAISETLNVARSNVSNSLKELQAWNLVRVTHQLGDRRDYFETSVDLTRARRPRNVSSTDFLPVHLGRGPSRALTKMTGAPLERITIALAAAARCSHRARLSDAAIQSAPTAKVMKSIAGVSVSASLTKGKK